MRSSKNIHAVCDGGAMILRCQEESANKQVKSELSWNAKSHSGGSKIGPSERPTVPYATDGYLAGALRLRPRTAQY